MSLCVASLYKTFPEIKAFGCCHEVFGTQKVLAAIASQELGTGPIDRKDIHVNVLGINHFTWFDAASYEGADLFPVYKKYIGTHFEEGYDDPDRPWEKSTFNCRHREMCIRDRLSMEVTVCADKACSERMLSSITMP